AHDRHDFVLLALQVARRRHAKRRGQPRARVTGAELIVFTLIAAQEPGQPAALPQGVQPVVATGQDLPRIALMPHVPDDLVTGRIERGAQRHRQLDDAEPGADVATREGDDIDEPLAYLIRQQLELFRRECLDVCGTFDAFESQFGLVTMLWASSTSMGETHPASRRWSTDLGARRHASTRAARR